ncbi:hypothetical protein DPMN_005233 [Dreissena polymorpha]|uniref:Uncharacterized protein n=1 Tax=Dreissena polymorpha TaxID=45954 RepID=A0A9D4FSA4_DREPO|nr:hypothetical protein DPMN_131614 [Dreissena polymorpha]KAH3881308.1 hypothetical protein DPMN_005233 [Dreissena polymorpha]
MVEPTIWHAWEGEKAETGRRVLDKTDLWLYQPSGPLGRRGKAETGMREEDKTDLW